MFEPQQSLQSGAWLSLHLNRLVIYKDRSLCLQLRYEPGFADQVETVATEFSRTRLESHYVHQVRLDARIYDGSPFSR